MPRGQGLPLDPARLRAARTAAGLSQRQVAERLRTTRQQVIRYEQGSERPEVKRLAALAAAVGATVADLVEEGALPEGLAGLRVGAGLTLAAAADAVRAQLPTESGIACSRPVLADAERGVLPPTWAPPPAAGAVRNALGVAYGAQVEEVAATWSQTFGTAVVDVDQAPAESGSINSTSSEGLSETTPPVAVEDDLVPGVAVLVSGDPTSDRPYLWVDVNGEPVGHLEDLSTWNGGTGWAFFSPLTDRERRSMTRVEQGGRPPEATTTVTDVAAAVRDLLPQVLQSPVRIDSLHGHHTGLTGMWTQPMERWELYRGRVAGREDVYARGRCWGWLQPAHGGGRTAHTLAGPVPGGPWPTREDAALALWAHLNAPLPPPRLGERAGAKRRLRPQRDDRPLCPYTEAELARVRLVRDRPEEEHSPYRAESPADHRTLGYVWRRDARSWSYAPADPATGRPAEDAPHVVPTPSRAAALERLLAQPGPLWGNPADAIVH